MKGSGVDVIGDLDDLLPGAARRRLGRPRPGLPQGAGRAAIDALAAMTEAAASRPDPSQELGARIRTKAERLRKR